MVNNCIYCKSGLQEDSVIDVCYSCGLKVWGEKMFSAIVEGMENARDAGNLYQGSVTGSPSSYISKKESKGVHRTFSNSPFSSLVEEAVASQEVYKSEKEQALQNALQGNSSEITNYSDSSLQDSDIIQL